MRKLLCILLLTSPLFAQTFSVSGHVVDPTTAVPGSTGVTFSLVGTGNQQCKVSGTGLIVPGFVTFTPNVSTGVISGTLYRNDFIVCGTQSNTQWQYIVKSGGNPQPACILAQVASSSLNLDNTACSNTTPVVTPPTGDNTYCRIDGSNCGFTGAISANAGLSASSVSVSGALSVGLYARDCRQDGTIDVTGTNDSSAVINTCIANAVTNNQGIITLPCGQLKINTALNLTNRPSLAVRGCGSNSSGFANPNSNMTTLNCNTGGVCVDTTGSSHLTLEEFSLRLANAYSTPSTIGILEGRDNALGGGAGAYCFAQFNKFRHVDILTDHNAALNGGQGYFGLYNVAAEHQIYEHMKITADSPMLFATTNIWSVSSAYQTLQTGCVGTMTGVLMDDISLTTTNTHAIQAWNTAEFSLNFVEAIFGASVTGAAAVDLNHNNNNWKGHLHIENMPATSDAIWFFGCDTGCDHIDMTAHIGGSVAGVNYIGYPANNAIITNSSIAIDTHDEGTPGKFMANVATGITWAGGVLDISGTSASLAATNTVLTDAAVIARGFTDSQVSFGSGSSYFILSDSGSRFTGLIGIGTAPNTLAELIIGGSQLSGAGQIGVDILPTSSSAATAEADALSAEIDTAAAAFTQALNVSVHAKPPTIGAGSAVTEWDGVRIEKPTAAGTVCEIKMLGSTSGSSCLNPPATAGVSNTLPSTAGTLGVIIASGTSTLTTTAVTAGTCQTTVTTVATGAATTDAIEWSFASAPTAATDGVLILQNYVTSGNVNFMRCNPTAGSITPTALVINWKVVR